MELEKLSSIEYQGQHYRITTPTCIELCPCCWPRPHHAACLSGNKQTDRQTLPTALATRLKQSVK